MRVLIVDDSEALVQRLTSRLNRVAGVEIVGSAANVADAELEIRKTKPDVVILDIRMPDGSGIDVLESLKSSEFQPIVIMLSNYSELPYRRKCLQSGARFFFDKSTELEKACEALGRMTHRTSELAGDGPAGTE